MPRSHLSTTTGEYVETYQLANGDHVPSTMVRVFKVDGSPVDVLGTDDGKLETYDEQQATDTLLYPPRALQYARDASDQMRVNVSAALPGGAATIGYVALRMFDSNGAYAPWYASGGGVATMDQREVYEQQTREEFNQQVGRWTFS